MKMLKRIISLTTAVISASAMLIATVSAGTPYMTFTRQDRYGWIATQTAYEPLSTITKIDDISLSGPSDLRMGPDGNLYIADTNNKRIVISTIKGELVGIVGEGTLKKPRGVFVDDKSDIYVADEDLQKIIVFDKNGEVKNEYGKPTHPLFGDYAQFKPQKVAVDKRGNMYITSKGNTNGIIQISPSMGGEFLGYFGANQTRVTFITMFRNMFLTDDQMAKLADVVPITTTNLDIDEKGLVYTVSQGDKEKTLKKLNVAGKNILTANWYDTYPAAVTTNKAGNIFMASKEGYIYEYSSEGKLIFLFGGKDVGQQRTGLFSSVAAIVVDDENRIYALDEVKNSVEIFKETEFAKTIHTAFSFLDAGKYIESEEPWTTVIEMNSMFSFANIGLGEAKFRQTDYDNALKYFRIGSDTRGYSDTFWEIRSDWLKDKMGIIITIAVFILVASAVVGRIDRKKGILAPVRSINAKIHNFKFFTDCTYIFHSLKNPNDTAYGIKREKRTTVFSSVFMLVLLFIFSELTVYASGFLFKTVPDGYYDIVGDAAIFFGVFAVAVICCYLVCTITEGEASFKQLIQGGVCSLAPLFITKPLILVLSNVLTLNEAFFINVINVVGIAWSVLLVFLAIKNLNDYSVPKTIATVLLTIFVALVSLALLFVIYVLISQVIEFISAIAGEVVYKIA